MSRLLSIVVTIGVIVIAVAVCLGVYRIYYPRPAAQVTRPAGENIQLIRIHGLLEDFKDSFDRLGEKIMKFLNSSPKGRLILSPKDQKKAEEARKLNSKIPYGKSLEIVDSEISPFVKVVNRDTFYVYLVLKGAGLCESQQKEITRKIDLLRTAWKSERRIDKKILEYLASSDPGHYKFRGGPYNKSDYEEFLTNLTGEYLEFSRKGDIVVEKSDGKIVFASGNPQAIKSIDGVKLNPKHLRKSSQNYRQSLKRDYERVISNP